MYALFVDMNTKQKIDKSKEAKLPLFYLEINTQKTLQKTKNVV